MIHVIKLYTINYVPMSKFKFDKFACIECFNNIKLN